MNITYSRVSVKVINSMGKATKQRIKAGIEKIPKGDIRPCLKNKGCTKLKAHVTYRYGNKTI